MENLKLKIGEFSKMMQVTVKTLRHYEQMGLLLPCEVDNWTGYRYYKLDQMQRLNDIRRLKDVGFSLEEIKDLYGETSRTPGIDQLEEKIMACEAEMERLLKRREQLHQMVDSQRKINSMEKFSVQSLPEIIVASHREVIKNYQAIGEMCCNVIGPEMQRLGCKCSPSGYCFTIEHNKEYKHENVDIEYCEQVEEMLEDSDIVQFKKMPAVKTALCMKHLGPYDRFYQSYTEMFKYIEENGYKIVGDLRCVYVDGAWNQDDPEKWLTIIQVPVER
ncbi:MAG: MerR family transcriptional regulator [Fibrobacter sp.]|nr:MerR family transcriptional regulator [Fibrobacter sp.]